MRPRTSAGLSEFAGRVCRGYSRASRLVVLTASAGLAQQDYPASNVFIAFERKRGATSSTVGAFGRSMAQQENCRPAILKTWGKAASAREPDEPNTSERT
jgi:hypothetical protein